MRLRQFTGLALLFGLFLLLSRSNLELAAQQKVVSPIVVAPQAPTVNPIVPYGVQRGTSTEIVLTGTNLHDPVSLWTGINAKVSFPTDANNGKDSTKLRVKIDVPADAPIGFTQLRLATKNGVSNLRLFCIDDLPNVVEVETNKTRETAQEVPFPSVLVGKIDNESSDFFKVKLKENQRLSVEVIGRRLGSQLDPVIFIRDGQTGREMGGLYSDDAPGMQTDARLTHTFKAGEYVIEIRDTLHRGGGDFYYRLRIGDFPLAITTMPIAVQKGAKTSVTFAGPAVDGVAPVEVNPTQAGAVLQVAPKRSEGNLGWPVSTMVSELPQMQEQEPNNDPSKANPLTVPCGVSGRFLEKNDVDFYKISAKKDQKFVITADTYEIGSPCETYLIVKNAKGAEIAKSNPQQTTAKVEFTADADGEFLLSVEHLNYAHGPNEIYHLTVKGADPEIDVALALDRFDAAPGSGGMIPILSATKKDYSGPIELTLIGHPGITGSFTIPADAPPVPQGQVVGLMPFQVKGDVPLGAYELKVQVKGNVSGKGVIRIANITEVTRNNLNGLVFPPKPLLTSIFIGVTDKPLFVVSPKLLSPEAVRGLPFTLPVTAERNPAATEDIVLTIVGLPANVAPVPKNIAKGKNDGGVELKVAANAPLGNFPVLIRSSSKIQGKDTAYYSPPINLQIVLPVEIKAAAPLLSIRPGEKQKLKATATRRGGYDGPIEIEVKNLPANVSAPKVTLPKDKTEAEIELTATPAAAAGDKADVNLSATATGAAGQQGTSPNFTIRVEKADSGKAKAEPEKLNKPKEVPAKK